MKIVKCVQGTDEWRRARCGIPTASRFDCVITPKTAQPCKAEKARKYANELIAEWLLGEPLDTDASGFMDRGNDMEQEARRWYAMQRDVEVVEVGFCLAEGYGCSPDGLVGDDGLIEIKVPSAAVHIGYLLDGTDTYRQQIQGQLLVTGRAWCDFVSYSPSLPCAVVRMARDEDYIAKLRTAIAALCERLDSAKKRLLDMGYEPPPPPLTDAEWMGAVTGIASEEGIT